MAKKNLALVEEKSVEKKKAPPAVSAGISGLFSGKMAAPVKSEKKSKSKSKPIEELPEELHPQAEVFISGKLVMKAIEKKIEVSQSQVKNWCVKRFADVYAKTGTRPATSTVVGGSAQFDFIQTKRIYLNPDRVQAMRDLGVDIDSWTEIKGVNINYEAIKRHGLEQKLQTALSKMDVSEAILGEIFQPKFELKDGFFDALYASCEKSMKKGEELAQKMYLTMLALEPVNQTKNPEIVGLSGDTETKRLQSALKTIIETEIQSDESVEESDDE